ncbi:putative membrane-associated kinase regulator 2 [Camellia lanceoleosa]|uniref:Membrane-associated kinase regulator 2 n=1 Tax=Camellia lanceoleosa TaxID=1840588 RepID=A0ACC0G292_9ERIC|nr:putative membrane-associated kinase regulator 2 [Camellia lanceoleosa]
MTVNVEQPWLVAGDFNDYASQHEKRSFSLSQNTRRTQKFLDHVNNCNLIDLGSFGPRMTWTNNRQGLANTMERLDRAMCNTEWRTIFPEATVKVLHRTYSDHSPLVVCTQVSVPICSPSLSLSLSLSQFQTLFIFIKATKLSPSLYPGSPNHGSFQLAQVLARRWRHLQRPATTIVTAVTHHRPDTDDDDGPTVPPDEDEQAKLEDVDEDEDEDEDEEKEDDGFESDATTDGDDDDDEREFNLSPSDDLFFNGRLVPIAESKTKLQSSLLKSSATKFRVMMLKLKKSKANVGVKKEETSEKQKQKQKQSKFLTVKLKVEEVPIVSLFTRDNSSRSSSGTQKQQSSDESAFEDKKFSKYLKKVKPLYVRVSKRYGEKQRFSGQLSSSPANSTVAKRESEQAEAVEQPPPAAASNGKSQKQGSLPAGLRVVCKHLGKSRSASAAPCSGSIQAKRNDDSFLQQQDGIQSAILHCKRSFNEQKSKDLDLSVLFRSVSDTSHEKSMNMSMKCSMKCSEELKETGI